MDHVVRPICLRGLFVLIILSLVREPRAQDVVPDKSATDTSESDSSAQTSTISHSDREQQLEKRVRELEEKIEQISAQMEDAELERVIADAQSEAHAAQVEQKPEQREFLEGGLALQKLNPEITVSGDILAGLVIDNTNFYAGEEDRSGMPVREVGLHFQHVLDPYSMFKASLHFSPHHGAGVEEIYLSWFGLIPTVSFTVGRFRQYFGVLNRWHGHDLDQTSYPLALRLVLGEDGLVGNGFIVKWMAPPLWAHALELTIEIVDGDNETLFSGEHFSVPSSLVHLKNYYDLSQSTYLELGLTGMFGFNNRRGLLDTSEQLINEPWRKTFVVGADLTLFWSPVSRAKYRSFTWRSELYHVSKELPSSATDDFQHSFGLYSYLQYQFSARFFAGIRGDIARPTNRISDELAWDVVPYITFWQSEFVYLRLEYQHGQNIPYLTPTTDPARRTDNRVLLQIDFAAGPHKHEKY